MKIFIHREVGPLACNCYVVGDPVTKEAIVIDPGGDADALVDEIATLGLTITAIVATHAHFDHLIAAQRVREVTGAAFHLHHDDAPLLEWYAESGLMFLGVELPPPPEIDTRPVEGDELVAGSTRLEILHTPGHSPGSISLRGAGAAGTVLFGGDLLFAGSVGRTDLPGGDTRTLVEMIRSKVFPLGDDVVVYPGHGPATSVARERATNPFVGDRAPGGF
jgi:glyoxylase-like metal-dependent hydrolase (beta-lactamase superfamily II)